MASRALRLLASAGVEMVLLGPKGEPMAMTYLSHYTRTPATRRAQYEAFMTRLGAQVAAAMVRCKVLAQANALFSLPSVLTLRHRWPQVPYRATWTRALRPP